MVTDSKNTHKTKQKNWHRTSHMPTIWQNANASANKTTVPTYIACARAHYNLPIKWLSRWLGRQLHRTPLRRSGQTMQITRSRACNARLFQDKRVIDQIAGRERLAWSFGLACICSSVFVFVACKALRCHRLRERKQYVHDAYTHTHIGTSAQRHTHATRTRKRVYKNRGISPKTIALRVTPRER